MPKTVSFEIPHEPVAKGRPRSAIRYDSAKRPFISVYTDAKTQKFEKLVGQYTKLHIKQPWFGPIELKIVFYFPVMKSWTRAVRDSCLGQYKTSKPDIDNTTKGLLDGMNGIAFVDDEQVVKLLTAKRYVDEPQKAGYISITVTEL